MNEKKPKILKIEWDDSSSLAGWRDEEECKVEICHCETVGYFISEDKNGICLALNRTSNEGYKPYGHVISIPKSAIRKKTILRNK